MNEEALPSNKPLVERLRMALQGLVACCNDPEPHLDADKQEIKLCLCCGAPIGSKHNSETCHLNVAESALLSYSQLLSQVETAAPTNEEKRT